MQSTSVALHNNEVVTATIKIDLLSRIKILFGYPVTIKFCQELNGQFTLHFHAP